MNETFRQAFNYGSHTYMLRTFGHGTALSISCEENGTDLFFQGDEASEFADILLDEGAYTLLQTLDSAGILGCDPFRLETV